jgi:hypothetical protein
VLVECGGKIAGLVGETELAGRVRVRYCDLQQQGDRGEHKTETAAGPVGSSARLFFLRPYGHLEGACRELEITSLPKRVLNDDTERT